MTPSCRRTRSIKRSAGLIVAALVSVIGSGSVGSVDAATQTWGWFAAISEIDDWFLIRGDAQVEISGSSFKAELYDSRDKELAITLKGTIRGGRAEVVAVRLSTEDKARSLTGILKKVRWTNTSGGRETILLTEAGQPGGLTIGLTREVK